MIKNMFVYIFLEFANLAVKNNLNIIGLFLKLDCYCPFVGI